MAKRHRRIKDITINNTTEDQYYIYKKTDRFYPPGECWDGPFTKEVAETVFHTSYAPWDDYEKTALSVDQVFHVVKIPPRRIICPDCNMRYIAGTKKHKGSRRCQLGKLENELVAAGFIPVPTYCESMLKDTGIPFTVTTRTLWVPMAAAVIIRSRTMGVASFAGRIRLSLSAVKRKLHVFAASIRPSEPLMAIETDELPPLR